MTSKKVKTSQSKKGYLYKLKLPAESENLDIIRKFIFGIVSDMGFSEEEIYQIELAVDEACANIINHAYIGELNSEENINVAVVKKSDRVEITIADKGIGFDPDSLETPNMDEYLKRMRPGGLGVHLIKTLMDKVTFHIDPGVCNQVKMIKILQK